MTNELPAVVLQQGEERRVLLQERVEGWCEEVRLIGLRLEHESVRIRQAMDSWKVELEMLRRQSDIIRELVGGTPVKAPMFPKEPETKPLTDSEAPPLPFDQINAAVFSAMPGQTISVPSGAVSQAASAPTCKTPAAEAPEGKKRGRPKKHTPSAQNASTSPANEIAPSAEAAAAAVPPIPAYNRQIPPTNRQRTVLTSIYVCESCGSDQHEVSFQDGAGPGMAHFLCRSCNIESDNMFTGADMEKVLQNGKEIEPTPLRHEKVKTAVRKPPRGPATDGKGNIIEYDAEGNPTGKTHPDPLYLSEADIQAGKGLPVAPVPGAIAERVVPVPRSPDETVVTYNAEGEAVVHPPAKTEQPVPPKLTQEQQDKTEAAVQELAGGVASVLDPLMVEVVSNWTDEEFAKKYEKLTAQPYDPAGNRQDMTQKIVQILCGAATTVE